MIEITEADLAELVFDLNKVKAKDMKKLNSATDVDTVAPFLAKVVTSVPEHWGNADDPATYEELPIVLFVKVQQKIGDELGKSVARSSGR